MIGAVINNTKWIRRVNIFTLLILALCVCAVAFLCKNMWLHIAYTAALFLVMTMFGYWGKGLKFLVAFLISYPSRRFFSNAAESHFPLFRKWAKDVRCRSLYRAKSTVFPRYPPKKAGFYYSQDVITHTRCIGIEEFYLIQSLDQIDIVYYTEFHRHHSFLVLLSVW